MGVDFVVAILLLVTQVSVATESESADKAGVRYFKNDVLEAFREESCKGCSFGRIGLVLRSRSTGDEERFPFPGKLIDPATRGPVYEARAFVGACFSDGKQGAIVFQKERVGRKMHLIRSSALLTRFTQDRLETELRVRNAPSLAGVLRQVKAGRCAEVPGETQSVSPTPLVTIPTDF